MAGRGAKMGKAENRLKEKARRFFKNIKRVNCPTFPKERIVFNSKGLSHLFYKGTKKINTREFSQSSVRIALLSRAVKLLKLANYPQEETIFSVDKKKLRYWAFEGVINGRRIKVIIRQVGKGKKHFWSVIPAWRRVRGQVRNSRANLSKQ
jgi:hypothetical protein